MPAKPRRNGIAGWERDICLKKRVNHEYEVNAPREEMSRTKFYTSFGYTKQGRHYTTVWIRERITGRANMSHTADRVTIEAKFLMFYKFNSKSELGRD
ncbi:hypothetical protein NXW67_22910 [Bacteroides fragilis]|nr:hypothetical protein [Bacteroides fragilis]